MAPVHAYLLNTPDIEVWPAPLLRARSNHDARLLARASHVLRRKRDGRYLAVHGADGTQALLPRYRRAPGMAAALDALRRFHQPRRAGLQAVAELPVSRLRDRLDALGLDADAYAQRTRLALVP